MHQWRGRSVGIQCRTKGEYSWMKHRSDYCVNIIDAKNAVRTTPDQCQMPTIPSMERVKNPWQNHVC